MANNNVYLANSGLIEALKPHFALEVDSTVYVEIDLKPGNHSLEVGQYKIFDSTCIYGMASMQKRQLPWRKVLGYTKSRFQWTYLIDGLSGNEFRGPKSKSL